MLFFIFLCLISGAGARGPRRLSIRKRDSRPRHIEARCSSLPPSNCLPAFLRRSGATTTISTKNGKNKLDIDIEWSLSTGQLIRIRGGSTSDDDDSSDEDDASEYEDEYESDSDRYDSDSEYEIDYDSEEIDDEPAEESLASSVMSKAQTAVDEYDELLAPPAMQQFMISVGVMMLSNRVDIMNDRAVKIARYCFLGYMVVSQLFIFYVRMRGKAIDDRTEISIDNPLASLIPSGEGSNFLVKTMASQILNSKTTVLEYDLHEASKMNSGLLFPLVFLYFLHFKMKQVQPLLMQTASGISNLIYSPLFQVYVLRRNVQRPFRPKPNGALMQAMGPQSEPATDDESQIDSTVTEEPTVEDIDEEDE